LSATPPTLATGKDRHSASGRGALHREDIWPTTWIVIRLLFSLLNRKDDHGGSIGSTRGTMREWITQDFSPMPGRRW